MTARDEILARVRAATADVETTAGAWAPLTVPEVAASRADTVGTFAENVADYRAEVVRVPTSESATAIIEALKRHEAATAVVPAGLPEDWLAAATAAARVVIDDGGLTAPELDRVDAVVTAAALGIATTGTIVLDHRADQGRRAITLVPDIHVCLVRSGQLVHDVPEAVRRLRPEDDARPLTWISGPSATSDIELERVEGVHGPRTLVVVLVDEDGDAV
ncbi:lactate utilization protein C [Nostocoides sp. F2B08]|uniref:LutC/YkgG family protein n=1 Tax=Nostocoides sp. F2B08 TaxID=2653936 RepID=UPI00126305AC|nr:LUD domain-containing protein [Tetrasphaera sp. F2B08]KAB7743827.1 lactate utilization protein C [Tetrasphaera sp. F2B08]